MSTNSKRRVVVTGIGAVSPLGTTAGETWNGAIEGRSGVGLISLFDPKDCPVQIAAEIKNFEPFRPFGPFRPQPSSEETLTQAFNSKDARKMGRFIQLALHASFEAYGDSGLDSIRKDISPERMGTNIGIGIGGLPEIEQTALELKERGYRRVTPFFIPQVIANMASGQLSILLHLQGPNLCNVTACASSAHSIGESARTIQRGDADIMICGGAEATISPLAVGGFAAMRALSTRNEAPTEASRPFDVNRDGFVIGEGAATLILEEYEHARKRGAKIYGEFKGYGLSADAYHMTSPSEGGEGGFRAMQMALKDAQLNSEQVEYVNAHGTSTPAGDTEEVKAIVRCFPKAAEHLIISSTKSMTGHLLGAAGALEALFTILALREAKIPPTLNLQNLDPQCVETRINFAPHRTVEKKVRYGLSNSFGFGGTNASLIFGKL